MECGACAWAKFLLDPDVQHAWNLACTYTFFHISEFFFVRSQLCAHSTF